MGRRAESAEGRGFRYTFCMEHRTRAGMAGRALGAAALACAAFFGVGCAKPLFSPEDERTQFDRFDVVRNQYASQNIEDEYGRKRPNLRARLLPKN